MEAAFGKSPAHFLQREKYGCPGPFCLTARAILHRDSCCYDDLWGM